jgi:hypothetical protein
VLGVMGLRRGLVVLLVLLLGGIGLVGFLPARPVAGQEPTTTTGPAGQEPAAGTAPAADDVAQAVAAAGWFADVTAAVDSQELEALAGRLATQGDPIGFAVLAAAPEESSTVYAEDVLDALARHGELRIETVAVLSPEDVGVVSDTWDDEAIDAALDDVIDDLRSDPVEGLERLADALGRQPTMAEQDADEDDDGGGSSGGGSSAWIILLVLGGIAVAVVSRVFRGAAGDGGYDDDRGSSYYDRRRWRRRSYGRSSLFSGSRRSGGTRSRRSSGGSRSRRGRGGRRL